LRTVAFPLRYDAEYERMLVPRKQVFRPFGGVA
jgi:hypothetical protein